MLKDNVRVKSNQQSIIGSIRTVSGSFVKGFIFALSVSPTTALADEVGKNAQDLVRQAAVKRASNTVACGVVITLCSAAAKNNVAPVADKVTQEVVKAGASNPKLMAAFGCGVAVAWCTKYALFDK